MILSMTGFGRGVATSPKHKITVEIKSLNSKQLDLFMRVPASLREMEVTMRNAIASKLERGKVELAVSLEQAAGAPTQHLDFEMLGNYKAQLEQMAAKLAIPLPQDWYATLMRLPDIWLSATDEQTEEAVGAEHAALMEATAAAADALEDFRITEGAKLYNFFIEKIANIRALLAEVEPFEKSRVEKIQARLTDQLAQLHGVDYDKGRLEQELIYYIEKLDVNEEKLRLKSHLDYFLETLGAPYEPGNAAGEKPSRPANGQGKKLGFIAQEMGREINTLGSKSNNAEMQKIVVKMKDELEQIKEQVLNVL